MAFVNIAKSGNQLTIEESNHEKNSSNGGKSFLQKIFSGRKENSTSATQLKASARALHQIEKPVIYDPVTVLDEMFALDIDPRLARFKR